MELVYLGGDKKVFFCGGPFIKIKKMMIYGGMIVIFVGISNIVYIQKQSQQQIRQAKMCIASQTIDIMKLNNEIVSLLDDTDSLVKDVTVDQVNALSQQLRSMQLVSSKITLPESEYSVLNKAIKTAKEAMKKVEDELKSQQMINNFYQSEEKKVVLNDA